MEEFLKKVILAIMILYESQMHNTDPLEEELMGPT